MNIWSFNFEQIGIGGEFNFDARRRKLESKVQKKRMWGERDYENANYIFLVCNTLGGGCFGGDNVLILWLVFGKSLSMLFHFAASFKNWAQPQSAPPYRRKPPHGTLAKEFSLHFFLNKIPKSFLSAYI